MVTQVTILGSFLLLARYPFAGIWDPNGLGTEFLLATGWRDRLGNGRRKRWHGPCFSGVAGVVSTTIPGRT